MRKSKQLSRIKTDILVVGGGAAGCYAALRARDFFEDVLIVSKGMVGLSSSSATLGGGANICFPEDDHDLWLREIVERGEYLNDQEWVKLQLEEVYPLAMQLDQWAGEYGLKIFEKDQNNRLARRKARGNINTLTSVIHGFPQMETFRKKLMEKKVKLMETFMATDLIVDEGHGRVGGLFGFDYRSGRFFAIQANAVVLAAGGCSFKIGLASPAAACTGEAQRMAYEAGAILRNLDQAMSHSNPKAIEMHGMTLFASVGGRFLNNEGEEFMLKYDPQVGSRARLTKLVIGMAREVEAGRGPIFMDLTGTSPENQEMLKEVLPEPMKAFESVGIDPFKEKIPWGPLFFGSQIHGGGIHIDTRCASNLPGLYAAGDTTCTPEHGTWSITGLNIAFAWLSGYRAGEYASRYGENVPETLNYNEIKEQVSNLMESVTLPIRRNKGLMPDDLIQNIWKIITPYQVCYLRNEDRLIKALEKLEDLKHEQLPELFARDLHGLVKSLEVKSMVRIAEIILRSVLCRKESRGFVYREDYPLTDNINWVKWIMVQKESEDKMKIWPQEFPTPYIEPPREKYSPL
jgi:succinate dehydrogenase/fumarate reductase flavoprotein subunit